MTREASASAPGKVILSGEHFVVHGSLAVAAAINKRATVSVRESDDSVKSTISSGNLKTNLDSDDGYLLAAKTVLRNVAGKSKESKSFQVSIASEIPTGSGLGSSAAVSVACAAALSKFLNLDFDAKMIADEAFLGEKTIHGNPSGLDIFASVSGGLIRFDKKNGAKAVPVRIPFSLVVIFSGKKRSTSRLIAKVARQRARFPNYFGQLVNTASYISEEVVQASSEADLNRLGSLFTAAQTQLSWINVSTPELDNIIEMISKKDVFGAKLTGAGGGGSVIVATKPGASSTVLKAALEHYPYSFLTEIPQEGIRWEGTKN